MTSTGILAYLALSTPDARAEARDTADASYPAALDAADAAWLRADAQQPFGAETTRAEARQRAAYLAVRDAIEAARLARIAADLAEEAAMHAAAVYAAEYESESGS